MGFFPINKAIVGRIPLPLLKPSSLADEGFFIVEKAPGVFLQGLLNIRFYSFRFPRFS